MRAENKHLLHCIRLFTNFQCTPFLIRLQICPHVVKFESTFPPGEGILVRTELFAKSEFDCCKSDTERVWEVTIPSALCTHWHRALRGKAEFAQYLIIIPANRQFCKHNLSSLFFGQVLTNCSPEHAFMRYNKDKELQKSGGIFYGSICTDR